MERFAFSLSAESKDWLEDRADELDITQADVMRRCIAQARRSGVSDTSDDTLGDTHPESDTPADTDRESLRDRIEALEDRVDAIEDRPQADTQDPQSQDSPVDDADAGRTSDSIRSRVMGQVGDGRSQNAKSATIDTVALLRARGPVGTGDIKGMLNDYHTDHYGSGESAWKSINSHVEQIDGVHQPGYGEWDYQPSE